MSRDEERPLNTAPDAGRPASGQGGALVRHGALLLLSTGGRAISLDEAEDALDAARDPTSED